MLLATNARLVQFLLRFGWFFRLEKEEVYTVYLKTCYRFALKKF